MEMRMPVRIVGAAAEITWNALRIGLMCAGDVEPFAFDGRHAKGGIDQRISQTEQIKIKYAGRDGRLWCRKRQRHPDNKRSVFEHLDGVKARRSSGDMPTTNPGDGHQHRQQNPSRRRLADGDALVVRALS
jgi:hypothetical protein